MTLPKQLLDELGAARSDAPCLLQAPALVAHEEGAGLGRQVVVDGTALARALRARMGV